jgi:hypothetical protein
MHAESIDEVPSLKFLAGFFGLLSDDFTTFGFLAPLAFFSSSSHERA